MGMTYVIGQPCVDIKDRACVDECPVDCIYEGARMLYIHPDECVDCGACEPVCPVEAIYYEDDVPEPLQAYIEENVKFFTDTLPGQTDPLGSPGGAGETRRRRCRHADGGGAAAAGRLMPTDGPRRRGWATPGRARRDPADAAGLGRAAQHRQRRRRVGVHPNTVRFHLDALVRRGPRRTSPRRLRRSRPTADPVSRQPPDGPGRTDELSAAGQHSDRLCGRDRPDAAGIAAPAGPLVRARRWSSPPAAPRAVEDPRGHRIEWSCLAESGFEPEPADGRRAREIRLRHCPFQNLAERHGEVICSVHLGLMQGALAAMRAPVTVDRLDPFVEPDLCVAHLAPAPRRDRESS